MTVGLACDERVLAAMGNPEPGQERPLLQCFSTARRLVRFFLFLTAFIIFYCEISLVPNFKSGITIAETLVVK